KFLHLRSSFTGEEGRQVGGVAEEVTRRHDGPGRNLVGDVLRGDLAHLEISALEGDEFRALLEKISAVIAFKREVVGDRLGKLLHHVGADVLLGEHGRKAQFWLILSESRERSERTGRGGTDQKLTACGLIIHLSSSLLKTDTFH